MKKLLIKIKLFNLQRRMKKLAFESFLLTYELSKYNKSSLSYHYLQSQLNIELKRFSLLHKIYNELKNDLK